MESGNRAEIVAEAKITPAAQTTSVKTDTIMRPGPLTQPLGWLSVTLAILTSAMWGGNAVATSFALDQIPPFAAAALRFLLATVFMVFWCLWEGKGIGLRHRQIRPALILGLLMFLQIGTFNIGIALSNSSHGVLLVSTAVFWVLIIEHFFTKSHRMTLRKTAGVALAFSGTALIITTSGARSAAVNADTPTLGGDLVLMLSALLLGVKVIYTRQAAQVVEPGKLMFWHDLIGALLFVVCSAAFETVDLSRINTQASLALLYQGLIVGGLCFAVQAVLLQKHVASQIAVFGFAAPLFGVLLSQLLREDPLSPWLLVAAVCVAVGIVVVNWNGN